MKKEKNRKPSRRPRGTHLANGGQMENDATVYLPTAPQPANDFQRS